MYDIKNIKDPTFIKNLNTKELEELAKDIRHFLIENVTKTGGHLGSNLGVVELTIALHYCFDFLSDKLIFDVGHQSYVHKILTGRANKFDTLRKYQGLSGYQSIEESKYDCYEAGHSSTSISAQTGFIYANNLEHKDNFVISVIGDASFSNGLVFEALNQLGLMKTSKALIILNDNGMGITPTKSSLSKMLSKIRINKKYQSFKKVYKKITPNFLLNFNSKVKRGLKGFVQKSNIFEDLGFRFLGSVDGHNIKELIKALELAKKTNKPTVLHVITKKGYGYENIHSISIEKKEENKYSWSYIISNLLIKLNEDKEDIYVITPAMLEGTKLSLFKDRYPNNIIDVGIAEGHAAIFATSLSMTGKKVFLSYYSTFAQRAYDQLIHDVSPLGKNIVIGLDRANIVQEDGRTHQGIYDLAYISHIPNTIITMPSNYNEAYNLLRLGFNNKENKIFYIRYPKLNTYFDINNLIIEDLNFKWKILSQGEIVIITYGELVDDVVILNKEKNLNLAIINALFIKPIDKELLKEIFKTNKKIIIYENVIETGSLYSMVLQYANKLKVNANNIYNICLEDIYLPQGDLKTLKKINNVDIDSVYKLILKLKGDQDVKEINN